MRGSFRFLISRYTLPTLILMPYHVGDIDNLVSAKTFTIIGIDLKNVLGNFLPLFCTISWFSIEMFIVCASVNPKNLTEELDIVLKAELTNSF